MFKYLIIISILFHLVLFFFFTGINKETQREYFVDVSQVYATYQPSENEKKVLEKVIAKRIGDGEFSDQESEKESSSDMEMQTVSFSEISKGVDLEEPEYPELAKRWGMQGVVKLGIYLKVDGTIDNVKLIKSSGHDILDESAILLVQDSWHFPPQKYPIYMEKEFEYKIE